MSHRRELSRRPAQRGALALQAIRQFAWPGVGSIKVAFLVPPTNPHQGANAIPLKRQTHTYRVLRKRKPLGG